MTEQDKQRIEKEADDDLAKHSVHPVYKSGYVSGATAEHERMAELLKEQIELVSVREAEQDVMAVDTVRLMDQIEYQKKALKEDYDKITKLEFELKEERNKAIDDVVFKVDERISGYTYIEGEEIAMLIRELMELKPILESLKGKSQ